MGLCCTSLGFGETFKYKQAPNISKTKYIPLHKDLNIPLVSNVTVIYTIDVCTQNLTPTQIHLVKELSSENVPDDLPRCCESEATLVS